MQESDQNIWSCIDDSNDPRILFTCPGCRASGPSVGNAEGLVEGEVRPVRARLIPPLIGGAYRAKSDEEVHHLRLFPSVSGLVSQGDTFVFGEFFDIFEAERVLRDDSPVLQQGHDVLEVVLGRVGFDVLKQIRPRNANQWILDPGDFSVSIAQNAFDNLNTHSPLVFWVISATLCLRFSSGINIDPRRASLPLRE
jgi:hypothetical protein